jgi:nuclear transport factor 2 (NTF2) superfamily protein
MTRKSSKDSTHVDHKDWGEGRSVTAKPGPGGSRRDFLESTSLAAASALLAPRGLFAADDGVAKTARTSGETTEATIQRPPLPPFTHETAIQKVRLAEDGWNSRTPEKVALAYTIDSRWRNRSEFVNGRQEIIAFLTRKWAKELDYRLIKELWGFEGNRIAVRFAYEWHDDSGSWFRAYGNENWEFDENGLMRLRFASINDLPILESDRKYHWALGRRPDDHPGLSDLGL